MPIYPFKDNESGKVVEVLRDFADYKVPPTVDESIDSGMTQEEAEKADWVKIIGKNIQVTRGSNWTGSKGNW